MVENIVIENPLKILWFAVGVAAILVIYKILQNVLKKVKKS